MYSYGTYTSVLLYFSQVCVCCFFYSSSVLQMIYTEHTIDHDDDVDADDMDVVHTVHKKERSQ